MAMTISEQNYINDAINRARGAYNNAIETARRNAERMGLNPNSGKFSAIENAAQFDIAAATAATANEASSNWLKTAQAQANEDEAMRLKYSALDLEREQLDHKIWLDKENLKKERQAAERYENLEERAKIEAENDKYDYDYHSHVGSGKDFNERNKGDSVLVYDPQRKRYVRKYERKKYYDNSIDDLSEYRKQNAKTNVKRMMRGEV